MVTGNVAIPKPQDVVLEKLRGILGAANCEVVECGHDHLTFCHGTYLTQTATLSPKTCRLRFSESNGTTTVSYEVHTAPFIRICLTLWGILLCWTIVMPIVAYRTLVFHPKQFVENLLAGV